LTSPSDAAVSFFAQKRGQINFMPPAQWVAQFRS
jgi:hypothetical protein